MKCGVCLEMFFTDRPFLSRIAAAGEAGCKFAEMWFTDMTVWAEEMREDDPKDPARVKEAAEKAGLAITNAVVGSPDGSIGGGLIDPGNRRRWLARAEQTFRFCRDAGISAAIVCTGNAENGRSAKQMRKNIVTGLKETVKRAEEYGLDLYLEPLNTTVDHPGYFLTSADEAAEICREVGSPRMKVVFDCYHTQIMEGDLSGRIRRNLDVIGHMHCAGHPGRNEPWLGEVDYRYLVKEIEGIGYDGVFAFEYNPTIEPGESLRRARAYLNGEGVG
jgi:hydroxypyruvate isomerase